MSARKVTRSIIYFLSFACCLGVLTQPPGWYLNELLRSDLPEDELVEFQGSQGEAITFPVQRDQVFPSTRAEWRRGAMRAPVKHMTLKEIDALFATITSPDSRLPTSVPLGPFIKYLWTLWPNVYDDFPSPKKIQEFKTDELIEGDWQYTDLH